MKHRLVDLVACPYCRSPLRAIKHEIRENHFNIPTKVYCSAYCSFLDKKITNADENLPCEKCYNLEIWEGVLQCLQCGASYPIINGIPRFLRNEFLAQIADFYIQYFAKYRMVMQDAEYTDNILKTKKRTVEVFSRKWLDFNEMYKAYESQFLTLIQPVEPDFFKDKLVLDAGCGSGRDVYYSSLYGAETVGIDLSLAVETAYKNTNSLPFTHIIQADIYNLPFRHEVFDFVFSIGVLHHLPTPENAFQILTNYVKRGGHIFAWVQGKENNYVRYFVDPMRRYITKNLPLSVSKSLSFVFTVPLYIVLKLIYGPLNKINGSLAEKVLPIDRHFAQLSTFTFPHIFAGVFDNLTAPLVYYTEEEFKKWFEHAKLKNVELNWCRKNSWGGIAEKP